MPKFPIEFKPAYDAFIQKQYQFDNKIIGYDEYEQACGILKTEAKKYGLNVAVYDEAHERRPQYPAGDNSSRSNFTYGPSNKKWQLMHKVLKPAIIATVGKMHKWIVGEWDRDAFVYDDPRLQILNERISTLILELFDHTDYKLNLMNKGADILLFILKEDIYWRPRILDMLNRLPIFILTPEEIENIQTYKKGIGSVDPFTMEPPEAVKC